MRVGIAKAKSEIWPLGKTADSTHHDCAFEFVPNSQRPREIYAGARSAPNLIKKEAMRKPSSSIQVESKLATLDDRGGPLPRWTSVAADSSIGHCSKDFG